MPKTIYQTNYPKSESTSQSYDTKTSTPSKKPVSPNEKNPEEHKITMHVNYGTNHSDSKSDCCQQVPEVEISDVADKDNMLPRRLNNDR